MQWLKRRKARPTCAVGKADTHQPDTRGTNNGAERHAGAAQLPYQAEGRNTLQGPPRCGGDALCEAWGPRRSAFTPPQHKALLRRVARPRSGGGRRYTNGSGLPGLSASLYAARGRPFLVSPHTLKRPAKLYQAARVWSEVLAVCQLAQRSVMKRAIGVSLKGWSSVSRLL